MTGGVTSIDLVSVVIPPGITYTSLNPPLYRLPFDVPGCVDLIAREIGVVEDSYPQGRETAVIGNSEIFS
jgi:hypothetical protein